MPKRTPAGTASVVRNVSGAKLTAPAAERNADSICQLLESLAPRAGSALEIASGTGQHIVRFARAMPWLHWQPSDIDPIRRSSIDAYVKDAALDNLATACHLDATAAGWAAELSPKSLIILINLLHLISDDECAVLIREAAIALAPNGVLVLYGPFMRSGELTSEGDRSFHNSLREQDSEIGYKDDFDTLDLLFLAGLELRHVVEMPANNLALVLFRPD